MWGWDVHSETYPYDNRPQTPLQNYTFDKWWFVSVVHSVLLRRFQIPIIVPLVSMVTWTTLLNLAISLSSPPVIQQYPKRLATRVPPSIGRPLKAAPIFVMARILAQVTRWLNTM